LADWLVLTWKASLRNCFCWFVLHFWEITYAKNSVFRGYLLEIFCWAKNKRNLCFAQWWSHQSVVFAASFIIHIIILCNSLTVASLAQANKVLNGPDSSLFCRDTGSIWGWLIFFSVYFSNSFKNQNIYFKKNRAVEAAKCNRLSLRCVKIHLRRMPLSKLSFFCVCYFSKTKHKSTKQLIN